MVSLPNPAPLDSGGPLPVDARQVVGYWIVNVAELPTEPAYNPTGAFLPDTSVLGTAWFEALDLVDVQTPTAHEWRVLSHAAVDTYSHSAALREAEPRFFVSFRDGARVVFECEPQLRDLDPEEIGARFGANAAARARDDWDAVVLRMRRVEAEQN